MKWWCVQSDSAFSWWCWYRLHPQRPLVVESGWMVREERITQKLWNLHVRATFTASFVGGVFRWTRPLNSNVLQQVSPCTLKSFSINSSSCLRDSGFVGSRFVSKSSLLNWINSGASQWPCGAPPVTRPVWEEKDPWGSCRRRCLVGGRRWRLLRQPDHQPEDSYLHAVHQSEGRSQKFSWSQRLLWRFLETGVGSSLRMEKPWGSKLV